MGLIVIIKEPNAPDNVFFGLILVSLGPLNIFPKKKPPMSDAAQAHNRENSNILNCKTLEK